MQRLPRRHTRPELALRQALHARGVRFRLHVRDLPGRPDVVLVRLRLAVFVDGCFWHGCPTHAVAPRANAEFWAAKLAGNVARDRRKDALLRAAGWKVLHVWEHDDVERVATRITRLWNAHDAMPPRPGGGRRAR